MARRRARTRTKLRTHLRLPVIDEGRRVEYLNTEAMNGWFNRGGNKLGAGDAPTPVAGARRCDERVVTFPTDDRHFCHKVPMWIKEFNPDDWEEIWATIHASDEFVRDVIQKCNRERQQMQDGEDNEKKPATVARCEDKKNTTEESHIFPTKEVNTEAGLVTSPTDSELTDESKMSGNVTTSDYRGTYISTVAGTKDHGVVTTSPGGSTMSSSVVDSRDAAISDDEMLRCIDGCSTDSCGFRLVSRCDASSPTILEDDETESRGMLDFLLCRRAHHPDV